MRIGVIADTHIPDRARDLPQEIYKNFKGLDLILHAGDLVDLEVLNKLKTLSREVKAVSGNMDYREVVEKLPKKEIIEAGKFRIGLTHGSGSPYRLVDTVQKEFSEDNINIIVFGHSHSALNERKNGILFFNPGSPTDKVFSPYNSYGILEINDKIEAKIVRL